MRINFPIFNLPKVNFNNTNHYTNNYTTQPILKPLAFDTFEKTSFGRARDVNEVSNSRFPIKNIVNLRCPVCGLIMLTDEQIEEFAQDVGNKKGIELANALKKYEDDSIFTGEKQEPKKSIYRPQKQEIVNIIKNIAKENPNLSLHQLVNLERDRRINDLIADQLIIMDELEDYIVSCRDEEIHKEHAHDLLRIFRAAITGDVEGRPFSRKRLVYAFSNISPEKEVQGKVTEIVKQLPSSNNDINSWFVKYSRPMSSVEVARKLVQQSIPTTEHLRPKSKDGSNNMKNYICDCAECNTKRGNTDFDEWMETIPDFEDNLQGYLNDVQEAIDNGTIHKRYASYITEVIKTIRNLSNGKINLNEPQQQQ